MLYHFMSFITSTIHYQVALFQQHWSMLTYGRHLKRIIKLIKKIIDPLVSSLNLNKVYERLMYDQMYPFFDQIFSKLHCGFRKGFSAEQCLIHMIEKWWTYLDNGGHDSALLTDLQGFWLYRSPIVNCKTKCIWRRYKFAILFSILPWKKEAKNKGEWFLQ